MGNTKLTQEQAEALEADTKFGAGCTLPLKCKGGESEPFEEGDKLCVEVLPVEDLAVQIEELSPHTDFTDLNTGAPADATDLASALTLINYLKSQLALL